MLWRRWISPCPSSRSFSPHLLRCLHAPSLPHDLSVRSPFRRLFSTSAAGVGVAGRGSGGKVPLSRRAVHVVLLSLTGGFALSALNDLAIFHGCSSFGKLCDSILCCSILICTTSVMELWSAIFFLPPLLLKGDSKAIERASQNREVVEVLGEPIARGPWYDASLSVGHRRNTVSCKFPVLGPKGNAVLKIKAVRTGDDTWFSFLRHNDWDILISEALIQDEHNQTYRVILIDTIQPSDARQKDSKSVEPSDQQKKVD